jgi:hypothetical protein
MRILRSSMLIAGLALTPLALPAQPASAAVFVSVQIAPPALPVYVQPPLPGPDYIWTPGYWAYADPAGYYWVPGTWVLAPQPGLLWTPAYWGWENGAYLFHAGYWGPHVGFYGGINYGFGYIGVGFVGGRWDGGHFAYNQAVNHVSFTNIHNVYNERVNAGPVSRVSFNGGAGGINARPTPAEEAVARENHIEATAAQASHQQAAAGNRAQFASVNHGRPAIAASARPGAFTGRGVVAARAAAPAAARPQAVGPHPTGAAAPHGPRVGGPGARPHPAGAPHAAAAPHPRPQAARPAPRPAGGHPQGGREEEHH